MKRLWLVAALLAATISHAFGAGSISLSGSQQFDAQGRPLSGGLLYTFQSGTTTPQNAFQDTALTLPYSNPMQLDASGRVPFFYLADGNIKIRLSDSTGVTIIAVDSILVIGPSSGGGGGGSVDPTTVYQTGDLKVRYGTGTHTGWVRANARTIGSATSGATERANADTQTLFEYLWTADANLTVSGGRGGSANADWLANKQITLPDYRGRTLAGMDDMGNSSASRLNANLSSTTLGAAGGAQSFTLTNTELPAHTHSLSVSGTTDSQGSHTHSVDIGSGQGSHGHPGSTVPMSSTGVAYGGGGLGPPAGMTGNTSVSVASATLPAMTGTANSNGAHTHSVTSTGTSGSQGSGSAKNLVTPTIVQHIYLKL